MAQQTANPYSDDTEFQNDDNNIANNLSRDSPPPQSNPDFEDYRSLWKIGSLCEIYSNSNKMWCSAQIVQIDYDDQGEWLTVKYLRDKLKQIQRYSDQIRSTKQLNINNYQLQDDNRAAEMHKLQIQNLKLQHEKERIKLQYETQMSINKMKWEQQLNIQSQNTHNINTNNNNNIKQKQNIFATSYSMFLEYYPTVSRISIIVLEWSALLFSLLAFLSTQCYYIALLVVISMNVIQTILSKPKLDAKYIASVIHDESIIFTVYSVFIFYSEPAYSYILSVLVYVLFNMRVSSTLKGLSTYNKHLWKYEPILQSLACCELVIGVCLLFQCIFALSGFIALCIYYKMLHCRFMKHSVFKYMIKLIDNKIKSMSVVDKDKVSMNSGADFQYRWNWQENDGQWKPYDNFVNKIIERLSIGQSYTYTSDRNNQIYKIIRKSKNNGIQINTSTNVSRKCQRDSKIKQAKITKIQWLWQENDGSWKLYDNKLNKIIENLGNNATYDFAFLNNQEYRIIRFDKNTGHQQNLSSKVTRKIKRVTI